MAPVKACGALRRTTLHNPAGQARTCDGVHLPLHVFASARVCRVLLSCARTRGFDLFVSACQSRLERLDVDRARLVHVGQFLELALQLGGALLLCRQ